MTIHIHATGEATMPSSKYYRNVVRVEPGTSSRPKRGDGRASSIVGASAPDSRFCKRDEESVELRGWMRGDNNSWNRGMLLVTDSLVPETSF